MATGVRSFQVNGMPVPSGVVNRFDSVMTSLCGLPFEPFTSRKPSPPAPPDLLMTTIDCFIRLVLGDDALDDARHLVGAAAGAGRHDELDRAGRLPGRDGRAAAGQQSGGTSGRRETRVAMSLN